jgi:glycogen debranching enzyme
MTLASDVRARVAGTISGEALPEGDARRLTQEMGIDAARFRSAAEKSCRSIRENVCEPAGYLTRTWYRGYGGPHIFDWDSYFHGIFLLYMDELAAARGTLLIFFDLQTEAGQMARHVSNKSYTHLSEKRMNEHHKPFAAQSVVLYSPEDDTDWFLPEHWEGLKRYIAWYDGNRLGPEGLYAWHTAMESGMDDSVTVNPDRDPEPQQRTGCWAAPDLNAYMVREYRAMARLAPRYGDDPAPYREKADALAARIEEVLWNPETRFYHTYDTDRSALVPGCHGSGFMPLWADVAAPERARAMLETTVLDPDRFWGPFGVYSLERTHPLFQEGTISDVFKIHCGWNGPYWAPLQYVVNRSLRKHGFTREADELVRKTIDLLETQGDPDHQPQEYWLTDGRPGRIYPFAGWSLLFPFMALENLWDLDPTAV